jgi:hypothetical protein
MGGGAAGAQTRVGPLGLDPFPHCRALLAAQHSKHQEAPPPLPHPHTLMSFFALPRPLATAMRSEMPAPSGPSNILKGDPGPGLIVSVDSRMPSSPRTSSNTMRPIGSPVTWQLAGWWV